jgi:hypothetical protein
MTRDRQAFLLQSNLNGLDFVEIADAAQTTLRVHFLNDVPVRSLVGAPSISGGETIPTVPVLPIRQNSDWGWDDGHVVLTLRVAAPGDFSTYTLTLSSPDVDAFFGSLAFSFKAGCPSYVDCASAAPTCEPAAREMPAIDYLAKDFLSFRQALLDFSTQHYPDWQERSEADFGIMFLEALSAIGDELSYLQDRIASEASLPTATQRRSVTRHARLVDYEPGPAVSARAVLQFDVTPNAPQNCPRGLPVIAPGADGIGIIFETGLGLSDNATAAPLDQRWNRSSNIAGYWFDDSAQCLPVGSTSMFVAGHGHGFKASQQLLIETTSAGPLDPLSRQLDPPIRQVVTLLPFADPTGPWTVETEDRVFREADGITNTKITRITWQQRDALTTARDLANTRVIGNIVPATQGRTLHEDFMIGAVGTNPASIPRAVERQGASPTGAADDRPTIRLYTLANPPLAWLGASDGPLAPEIMLSADTEIAGDPRQGSWGWVPTLLSAGPYQNAFTLDVAAYRALPQNSDGSTVFDYDGDGGDTLRFGDGVFGINPEPGQTFHVTYRLGAGAKGNVAAGGISQIDQTAPGARYFQTVDNPFPATGGADAQTLLAVKRLAPQQFRSAMLRAVLPQDYVDTALTLPWVKRAGCAMRWTGSWFTTFTTPESVASEQILASERVELVALLNRFRMAGTDSYVPDPVYVAIDLRIDLCAEPLAFAAQVRQAVFAALTPAGRNASNAFFAVSRFGFGQRLYRSALEAAIQQVPGVAGVNSIAFRLRDHSLDFAAMGDVVAVGASQILRCDNDPSRPGAGALALTVGGGR